MTTRILRLAAVALPLAAALSGAAYAANPGDSMKFTLDKVTFPGNTLIPDDELMAASGLVIGHKIDRDDIVQAFQNVQDTFTKDKVNATITPKMLTTPSNHISVIFDIADETKVTDTKVNPKLDHETFTGNVKVTSDKIQAALTMKPGQDVTRDQVVADLNAISDAYKAAKVGASIKPVISYPTPGQVDINYEITEGTPKKSN